MSKYYFNKEGVKTLQQAATASLLKTGLVFFIRLVNIFHDIVQLLRKSVGPPTMLWKVECSCVKNGGFPANANTLFSTMVHSTSSSWITTSFFRIFIAYRSSVPLRSASITYSEEERGQRG